MMASAAGEHSPIVNVKDTGRRAKKVGGKRGDSPEQKTAEVRSVIPLFSALLVGIGSFP